MRHIVFGESDTYPVALLIKATAFNQQEIQAQYVDPLSQRGIDPTGIVALTLAYENGKAPVKLIKEHLEEALPALASVGATYLYVADSAYFKVLTRQGKAEPHWGYVLPCAIKGYEHMHVVLGLNYQALIYNPDQQAKLDLSLKVLADHCQGSYQALGENIIHSAYYPKTTQEIRETLDSLHQYPELTCDIEARSLRFHEAGVGTIAFAWNEHNGVAFACDYSPLSEKDAEGNYGIFQSNASVRKLLLEFLMAYQGKLIWHNITYDAKVLIYTLWMQHLKDTQGLLTGLDLMTRNFDDSRIIAYLATNSTAGNVLGLKALAHEFAGNWAKEDINDIRQIPLPDLLQYNLVDTLSTWYVHKKYYPIMVQDKQEELYHSLMKPSLKTIIQIELTGMPMKADKIQEAKKELEEEASKHLYVIHTSSLVQQFNQDFRKIQWQKDFEDRKAKAKNPDKILPKPLAKFNDVVLNPNSGPQLQRLLYEQLDLPVIDYTDTKQPATGGDTLEKLTHHTQDPEVLTLLNALIGFGKVDKILTAFIPNFEAAIPKEDGRVYLHGSFNLGGTVSGRLSSSSPNLQQLPSGSTFGKLVKKCFSAPEGWIFAGADFNALEDRINTLLTKDPNKIKVFTEGYDSHCLRSFYFFPEKLPGIVETKESINSIKKAFPEIRQLAKSPAFALQYSGTWRTLVSNLGFEEATAIRIEENYHRMYAVSDAWVEAKIQQAAKDGYAETAFGLRIRAPLLKQIIWGSKGVPFEAAAEARTLGNAISGQAYGLLNNRALNAFMEEVWASPYRYDVLPIAMIHDASYLLIRDRADVVEWTNIHLCKAMAWQDLPEIQHTEVKLGAELDLFWPDWAHPITLPFEATQDQLKELCKQTKEKHEDARTNH